MEVDPGRSATIHILDDETINHIAAGEVVERPASVVKELVENSIDAGATAIEVEIASGTGLVRSIRVTDNGSGMSEKDAAVAFARHSTSKISVVNDIFSCGTLGFRGEALASIASVSRVTMTTRPRGNPLEGTRIVITGGTVMESGAAGVPEGTTFLVEDLFFNTPARKKFQKSLPRELAHIFGVMEGMVLAHPDTGFRLIYNGKEKIHTSPGGGLHDAVIRLYGTELFGNLIPVSVRGTLVALNGYISRPAVTMGNASRMWLSVNTRSVYSRPVITAIRDGYGTLLMKDRYPVVVLNLSVDSPLVDVNVHPAKRQIRISREKEVMNEITDLVRQVLAGNSAITAPPVAQKDFIKGLFSSKTENGSGMYSRHPLRVMAVREPEKKDLADTAIRLRQSGLHDENIPEHDLIPGMTFIGQCGDAYIIASSGQGDLVLIDQHAAHERVIYEQLQGRKSGEHHSQELIVPVVIRLSPRESAVLHDNEALLEREGFIIEEFGRDAHAVRAVPVVLGRSIDPGSLQEILSETLSAETGTDITEDERICRIIACKAALKAGRACTADQCITLLKQLFRTKNPYSCPHGRPTMISFSRDKLNSLFKRTG
jgi:DNA mismatch repair protein MutL